MVWDGQYGITWLRVIENHMTAFLANEMITNFTEGLDSTTPRDVGKCSHFRKLWQVCLQNIPEQVQLECAALSLWQREAIHEWPRGYYGVHPLCFYLGTCNQAGWDIQQHSLGNRSHTLIQREISPLSPP